jgi:hypothetical protein
VPLDGNQYERRLYPILVRGSHTRGRRTNLSKIPSDIENIPDLAHGFMNPPQKTKVKWFSGTKMHKALGIAAKSGPGVVKRLLTSAGNDIRLLDGCMPFTNLISGL